MRTICTALLAMTLVCAASATAEPVVKTGIDVLIEQNFKPLEGKKVGLITNPTGITQDLKSTIDVLHEAKNVDLVALYAPEHGIRGDIFAGKHFKQETDPRTGLPVYSVYGKKPKAEDIKGLDALIYDIQDIGCRSYTFVNAMARAMEAAAENDIEFFVLDRPNPLTGNRIEGNILDMKFKSGIGMFPMPYVYGLTCGELANLINEEGWLKDKIKCKLTVIEMKGWKRSMWFDETGLPWVPTSPHVPHSHGALAYVSTGIMGELHVINEGVGYTLPFELCGAPWIDADKFATELNARNLPGIKFRPITYRPYYFHFKDEICKGVQVYFTDRDKASIVSVQFHVMDVHQKLYPEHKLFEDSNRRINMFDKACGTDQVRKLFLEGKSADKILKAWDTGKTKFKRQSKKYYLYN